MTDIQRPDINHRGLPLHGDWHSGKYATCSYKCNDDCHKPSPNPRIVAGRADTFAEVAARAISRRNILKSGMAAGLVMGFGSLDSLGTDRAALAQDSTALGFTPVPPNTADTVTVPEGYQWRTFLRWGDPILPGTGGMNADYSNITPERQAGAFGYNNDYVAYLPATRGGQESDDGLLWVNHEYTNPELMFYGYNPDAPTNDQINIEMNAHGGSVVEVRRNGNGAISYRRAGALNRRITAFTPIQVTGPAAGHELLQTTDDPAGTTVLGTLNNCAGGQTPWGTILTAEENFDQYFGGGDQAEDDPVRQALERYSLDFGEPSFRKWETLYERFDLAVEPNEPNRFGWVVEVDPYDPESTPKKRTAMGRLKHEGAEVTLSPDGTVVAYMGDDARFDYLYKFVSDGTYANDMSPADAGDLLDARTVYVAVFNDDQTGTWIPLIHGENGLTSDNGFADQGEVLIKMRLAGDIVGATPMDRPEDVQPDPNRPGYVYVALTNNTDREDPNAANPRVPNPWGHVIEIIETGGDAAAATFNWDFLLLCGDPDDPDTFFGGFDKSQVSPISAPDNFGFTPTGSLLVATDGQPRGLGINDAFHFVPLTGPERGHVQQFCTVPVGAEACGPAFTPDGQTLFLAVQHPGDDGTIEEPLSSFPDANRPARPAMVSIWKDGGGVIGT